MLPDITPIGIVLIYLITYFTLFTGFYLLFIFIENKQDFGTKKTKRLPEVSIIIPVYNGAKCIKDCLTSLSKLDYPKKKLEIIVVDDGSTDNSFTEAKKFKVKVYKRKHSGKARAVNYGIDRVRGELIGILDVDSCVEGDSLKKMVGYFDDNEIGAVHSGIRVKNPTTLLEKFQDVEYTLSLFFKKLFSFVNGLYVTPGVFSIYRGNIFKKIGKFDSDNVTEDLEIALRLLSKKYKIMCATEARTYTQVPKKFRELQRQRVRWNFGLIKNLRKYSFLLSRKYNELGYFVLPTIIIGQVFLLMFFSYILVSFIFSLINNFSILLITGIEPFLSNLLNFHFSLNFLQSEIFFYSVATLSIGLIFVYYAKKHSLFTKTKSIVILQYLCYLLVSGYLYSYFWILTFYKILRKDIKW